MYKFKFFYKDGQGAVEYILLIAAVLIIIILFLSLNGPFHQKVESTLNASVDQLNRMATDWPN